MNRIFYPLLTMSLLALASYSANAQCTGISTQIGGTVFRDYNADGTKNGAEPGAGGITVKAYDDDDPAATPTATVTTAADGTYLLTGLAPTTKYRLEFTWTNTLFKPGAAGGTSVQVATSGACNVNMGVNQPAEYCQDNPKIMTSCYVEGPNTGSSLGVMVAMNFNTPVAPVTHEATGAQIGTTYGLAYQRSSDILFAAAFQKRFSGYGGGSPGAIYKVTTPTNGVASGSVFLDLNTLFGSPVAGTDPHVWTLSGGDYTDNPSFNEVGRMSFGDLEISEDELSLYVINLKDRSLYIIPLGTDPANPVAPTMSSQVTVVPLADPGNPLPGLPAGVDNAEIIPFALKVREGKLYIGFVGNGSPLVGFVYEYDIAGGTFTKVLEFPLDFNRGCGFAYPAQCRGAAKWNPWVSTYPASFPVSDGFEVGYPQPIMADIEFDVNGHMLIGMRDRWGEQGGFNARNNPNNSSLSAHDAFGDIMKATASGGAWTLNVADFTDNTLSFGTSGSAEPTWSGDFYFGGGYLHEETAMGGLGVLLNTNQVATPSMDPLVNAFSNGIDWFNAGTGAFIRAHEVLTNGVNSPYGKANGLGEIELNCAPAPIEIGNYIWKDLDDDGVQDPGEIGINGVVITLWKDNGGGNFSQIASTTSAGGGFYGFSNKASGTSAGVAYNVAQLLPNMNYEVRVANVAGPTQQVALNGFKLGKLNQGSGSNGDYHDSDAAASGNNAIIAAIATGTAGDNNHSYDIAIAPNTDFGDLPDNNMAGSYPTNTTAGPEGAGACHEIVAGLKIGATVDIEVDGQPSALADGDDLGFSDDEDGISAFPTFIAGQSATVSVSVMNMQTPAMAATLYGFIDWNKDGDFNDANESTSVAVPDGTNGNVNLVFTVPVTAVLNMNTGARFRLSTQAGLGATGCAPDGEVEDYMVQAIGYDYGDLADNDAAGSYPTNSTDGAGEGIGACHQILPNIKMGASVDAEADGQPSALANGDDTATSDDENGIASFPTFTAGQSATVAVNVMNMTGGSARLYGFIDWNKDGDFNDLNEAVSVTVPNGTNGNINLSFSVPITAVLNMNLGARFRLSTQAGLGATGCATDGEVEDYVVQAIGLDYGDLPDNNLAGSYPTDATNGAGEGIGACHQIVANLKIGAAIDVDAAGQPDALAEGDDNNGIPDDEDGITVFPNFLLGNPSTVNVSVMNMTGSAATLYGFIDWNKDGDFLDANESVSAPVPNGTNGNIGLTFNVPTNAVVNMDLGFRVRLSNQTGLTAVGCSTSGEVEDYLIEVLGFDYGDLPDNDMAGSYPTNINNGAGEGGGACHLFKPGLKIGTYIDFEANGQPGALANGDDTNGANDDEDGITSFPQFVAGKPATVVVNVMNMMTPAGPATLYGFIDWNKDGDFNDANETVTAPVPNGTNGPINLNFNVPLTSVLNMNLGARFRLSTAFVTATDCAPDGEVEDYMVQAIAFDWGDLADDDANGAYPTNATNGGEGVGPSHRYYPTLKMGATIDFEGDGQPSLNADGDGADEDGVTFPTLVLGLPANITVAVMNMQGAPAKLTGFFDWNKDGDFDDANEMFSVTVANGFVGNVTLPITVPVTTVYNMNLGVRFRLSTDFAASMLSTGQAPDGEVEDYLRTVIAFDYGDLPDTGAGTGAGNYQTGTADNGPVHQIFDYIKIGNFIDGEGNGQQNGNADGDDTNNLNDDNIVMPLLEAGYPATIPVLVMNMSGSTAGLYAFFDWNKDGDFNDAGETVSTFVLNGTNGIVNLTVNVPSNAVLNMDLGARFRLSTDPAASAPAGFAADGEVEDYLVQVKSFDYGDLPDNDTPGSYATNATNGGGEGVGPSHEIVVGLKLGAGVDGEQGAQPSTNGDGDDNNGFLSDDEDGVTVPMFQLNVPTTVPVTLMNMTGGNAKLTLFIDWNGNGLFTDAGEMYSTTVANLATGHVFNVTPPANAVLNQNIGVRVRLSTNTAASMSPTGPAPDGEVEDYITQVMSFDYGDLADTGPGTSTGNYQTQISDNGPVHKIVTGLKLGVSVDGETNGNQSALANGDDTNGSDDEDGVIFPTLMAGTTAVVPVSVMNMSGQPAALFAFFDWNKDGDFNDPSESVNVTVPNGTNGNVSINVVIPVTAVPNMSLGARLRISTNYLAASEPVGPAPDGEVEDYMVVVTCPILNPSATQIPVNCYGGNDGQIVVNAGNIGTAPFDFAWDGPGGNDGSVMNVASPYTITGLPTGTYSITVTDNDGCTGTTSILVTQPGSPVSLSLLSQNVSCNGLTNGSINLMVAGGTFPYTYDWSNDGPESPDNDTEDLSGLAPGTYTVTVTDAKGCTATISATITQPAVLTATGVVTHVTCTGGTNGAINLTAAGGTLPYTYDWSNDGPENPDDDSADLNGIAAGTYTVTVTDANGCSFSTSLTVNEPPSGMTLTTVATDATCGLSNGALDLTVSGGNPGFTYDWSNDGPDNPDNDTQDLSNIPAGLYFVTVTDANGCTNNTFAVVGNIDGPSVTAVGTDPLCNGGNDGSVNITVTGGTAPFTYLWSNGAITEDITGLTAGQYMVTVTDFNGCKTMTMVTLSQPTALQVALTPINEGLCGDAAGSITAFASGGVGPYTYDWSNDGPDNPDNDLPTISNLAAGTYTVTVTDSHGCTKVVQTTLTCVQPASIGNYTWVDNNANGIQDAGEAPLPNVTVVLDGTDINGNMVNQTAVTGPTGLYLFDNLWPGTYKLTFATPPGGYVPTTANDVDATDATDSDADPAMGGMTVFEVLTPGENNTSYDAGYFVPGTMGNFVWNDLDGDGDQDPGEPGLQGVTVTLTGTDGQGNPVTLTTTTDIDGTFLFNGLVPGTYKLTFGTPAGMVTAPLDQAGGNDNQDSDANPAMGGMTALEVITSGENNHSYDAGYFTPVKVGNYVWVDKNANGIQDAGEQGLQGVEVKLQNAAGNPVTTDAYGNAIVNQFTNSNGIYQFNNLVPGVYKVMFINPNPAKYTLTIKDAGTLDAVDSDANQAMLMTDPTPFLNSGQEDQTLDAGFFVKAKAGDLVWNDLNGNGIQDAGEPGLNGVTVTLTGTDNQGNPVALSTSTAGNGMYMFGGLVPGTYKITFPSSVAGGYVPTPADQGSNDATDSDAGPMGSTPVFALVSGDTIPTFDAGYYQPAKIGNLVWQDMNANGIQDAGEPGIGNVPVTLSGTTGNGVVVNQSVTTDGTGMYMFSNLQPGSYKLTFTTPNGGYVPTQVDDPQATDATDSDANPVMGGMTAVEVLVSGENNTDYDAGYYLPGSIGNFVWTDEDGDGEQDPNEPGLQGVTITLTGTDGQGNPVTMTTTTDIDGSYAFNGLVPGTYKLTFNTPAGMVNAPVNQAGGDDSQDSDADPAMGGMTASEILTSGESTEVYDAGYFVPVKLGNYVWLDKNANGIQDAGEPGLANVEVKLLNGAGNPVLTDVAGNAIVNQFTSATGYYQFSNLKPGVYKVMFINPNPAKYTLTVKDAGTDDAQDSDANQAMLMSDPTPFLYSGDEDQTLDAGFFVKAKVGDFVWNDLNGNGIQNAGEPGINGVSVNLIGMDNQGNPVNLNTTTAGNGMYMFGNLVPGVYKITFGTPAGYVPTPADQGSNDATDSDAGPMGMTPVFTITNADTIPTFDAGFYQPAEIGNFVWNDTNADGIQNDGATGIAGVVVVLSGTDGTGNAVNQTTTTNVNGAYLFSGLQPGSYKLTFVTPAGGYVPTQADDPQATDATDSDANPAMGGMTVIEVLTSGESNLTYDAGYYIPASIGNFVWEDNDADGQQDTGEPGLQGVLVTLTGTDGQGNPVSLVVLTDIDGSYQFNGLVPGTYKLTFGAPSGMLYTPANQAGGNDNLDSDANPAMGGMTVNEVLSSGENNNSYDAGFFAPVSVGNYVWMDDDLNGTQDPGEDGLPNFGVKLLNGAGSPVTLDANGNTIVNQVTNANGYYQFNNLIPGVYKVMFINPNPVKYTLTVKDAGTNDAQDSDADPAMLMSDPTQFLYSGDEDQTLDAGFFVKSKVGDFVWNDLNGNGIQDAGEPGIPNAIVTLNGTDNQGIMSSNMVLTDANGMYMFGNLLPGTYKLTFNAPLGSAYVPTAPNQTINDAVDSDADPTNLNMTEVFTITSNDTILTYDAGFYLPAKIGNFVWNDLNANGIQDAGEPGIGSSEVILSGTTGSGTVVNQSTTTDGTGMYMFGNLAPGTYKLTFTTPGGGFVPTQVDDPQATDATDSDANPASGGMTTTEILTSGENNTDYDAGYYIPASIGNFAWIDDNANGVQEPGELPLQGVPVMLTGTDGQGNAVMLTTTTDVNGYYQFANLVPGTYKLKFSVPAGSQYELTGADLGGNDALDSDANEAMGGMTANEVLISGENNTDYDAGFYIPASLGDYVWVDKNANGVQDPGELPLSNVTVKLQDASGNPVTVDADGAAIANQVTNAAGFYQFLNLVPGTYKVMFVNPNPAKYTLTLPNAGTDDTQDSDPTAAMLMTQTTILGSGDHDPTLDAGFFVKAKVGDFVWHDLNGNGVQDGGEPGLNGVTVTLTGTDNQGNAVALTTTTSGNGMYMFGNLVPGTYQVTFPTSVAGGYVPSPADQGGNDATDSDAGPMGSAPVFSLNSGDTIPTIDAGYYLPAKIGNFVWNDLNANGIQDAGEPGINGAEVILSGTTGSGTVVNQSTTTDATGMYMFGNLAPGTYKLTFTTPGGGFVPTQVDDPQANDATDSDANPASGGMTTTEVLISGEDNPNYDAGYYIPASIGNFVWNDVNANGIQETGEDGIPNVTVTLTGTDGQGNPVSLSTSTDGNGLYLFSNLAPGTYKLTFGTPAGFSFTSPLDQGGNDNLDSDANASMANMTINEVLTSGENNLSYDAGFYPCPQISILGLPINPVCPGEEIGPFTLKAEPYATNISWSGGASIGLVNGSGAGPWVEIPAFVTTAEGAPVITVTAVLGQCTITKTFVINVNDATAPVLENCPASITVGNDVDKCGANVFWTAPTAIDNCDPDVAVTQSSTPAGFVPGSLFPQGTTTITYVANDGNGNTVSCTFNITVTDMQTPTAVCKDITVNLSAATNAGAVTVSAAQINGGSTDNCPASLTYAPLSTNYTCANVGDNNITLTVTDGAGNVSTCVATVTVRDVTPPVFTCPQPVTVPSCTSTVPNVIGGLTATDNCGIASITQNPVAGVDFGQMNGNSVNVTVTVTDVNGNTSTCTVVVTVADAGPPVFVNCPTTMIMIGNDPDQCSGKVNWPQPVALDECLPLANVVQTQGPLPGSVVAITCPPTPTTITYKATDGAGNMAFCTFQVLVVDTQKPKFDADILMPGNVTVECHQVPTNCIPRTGGACTPLTNDDVNDNCTAPANLVLTYNQVSTQGTNPALCSYYNYTLTRTWTVTDCAGNTLVHTQVITVRDTTKPTALCKNATIQLDKTGKVVLNPLDVDNGSTDNCAAFQYLTFSITPNQFTCANVGTNQVTLSVTDPCGNVGTCTATVTVTAGIAPCTPTFNVQTVCAGPMGMGNATTLDNGQFTDIITVKSLAMQTWTMTANSTQNGKGLYSSSSAAPPAAPSLLPVGTLFTAGTADGIDNDGDGATDEADEMIYYTLRALHVDCQGYDITVSNAGAIGMGTSATTTRIENKACYPTPYFTDELLLDDPFCLNTPPFTIKVGEQNNAAGSIVPGSVMVDGVATTTFNAATLGLGAHTIMATFDAGSATTNLVINGVQVGGTMAQALADPGCKQKITKIVHVIQTPATLTCNDLVYISMDASCKATINPDDVLEGTYLCFSDYKVEVDKTLPLGNGPWVMPMFDASDIGKTYQYRVIHIGGSTNICWGNIKIEDKLAPALTCPANLTLACSESTDVSHTGNVGIADCSTTTRAVNDEYTDFGQCNNPRGQIVRTWIVTDAWGNQSSCSQTITITPFDLAAVVFPADKTINCESAYLNAGATDPDNAGRPSINGFAIGQGGLCTASISYTDERFDICTGSYEILRTWKVRNTCFPVSAGNPISKVQVITVSDLGGPAFTCPPSVLVSTDPSTCCATAALPSMVVSEGCSNIVGLEAKVTGVNPANGNIITFTVPGYLTDFPGNNWWNPDTLAVFNYTQCMPVGTYQVRYKASDLCGNTSFCHFDLTVADFVPPVAACDQTTTVAVNNDDPHDCYTPDNGCDGAGVTWVKATTFDDGSYDNCNRLKFTIRRMAPYSACINNLSHDPCYPGGQSEFDIATAESDSIKFYCCEVGSTQTVILRVYQIDANGNIMPDIDGDPLFNECMIQVTVQDKIKPICQSPNNVTVSCEQFDPSLWVYGKASIMDNCCLDTTKVYQGQCGLTHSVSYAQFDTLCSKGTIVRTFRAFDCHGQSSQCTQRIVVNYEQDYFVRFPNDVIVTVCNGTGVYGEPTFFGKDCELLGISYEDQIFTVVPDACFKIERNWKIINWCTFNPNGTCITVPNPTPNATSNHPSNLPGPIVSPIQTTGDPWKSTIVKINSTDAQATNYSVYYDPNANCYTYKQIIKIIDNQAPTSECPASPVTVCDVTTNDADLWNGSYWWDNANQSHDLCEAPSDICLTATDACSGANINIEYLLFLDLDNDGTMETVVNSTQLGNQAGGLGWNNIMFGNATGAGTSRQFDGRAVATNQKWGFAIQETVTGNKKTACVKFNTFQSQNTYVTPQLPHGTHKIKWIVTDGCGNESVCEYTIIVKDCKAPTVVCLNGLSVNIMPTGMIQMWASDFLQYGEDNCTKTPYLKYGIRKCGQGTGFPLDAQGNPVTNVTFDCTELGTQCVELWAIDLAGNADYCETYVIVQDNNGNCVNGSHVNVSGALKTETADGVEEGTVNITGSVNFAPPFSYFDMSDVQGLFNVSNSVPIAADMTISPVKDDNPLNGVTTYDLVLISKHILGIEPLGSPYKMIAADANKSNSITTFDIVELRKLILGIYQELPSNTSWRFVDKAYSFPNPANPFQTQFPENISVAQAMTHQFGEDFVGVKIGDVNNTVVANNLMVSDERNIGTLLFDVDDRDVATGQVFEVKFKASEKTQGYQMTLNLNGLEVLGVEESDKVTASNFGVFNDALTVSIDGSDAFTVKFRATKAGKLSNMLGVSSRITKAEAYSVADGRLAVALRFDGKTVAGVGFELYQNQPNPFVNQTMIGFHLPESTQATLTVYDETGRLIHTQQGDFAKGYNVFMIDRQLIGSTGALWYRVETSTDSAARTMIQTK